MSKCAIWTQFWTDRRHSLAHLAPGYPGAFLSISVDLTKAVDESTLSRHGVAVYFLATIYLRTFAHTAHASGSLMLHDHLNAGPSEAAYPFGYGTISIRSTPGSFISSAVPSGQVIASLRTSADLPRPKWATGSIWQR